jgi:hypothetical protein
MIDVAKDAPRAHAQLARQLANGDTRAVTKDASKEVQPIDAKHRGERRGGRG